MHVDIEKRKSFADMKLAEVAAGGQKWNFEDVPEEPSSTHCDDFEVDENNATVEELSTEQQHNNGADAELCIDGSERHCNGHDDSANNETAEADMNGSDDVTVIPPPASRPPPSITSTIDQSKTDPVTEISPDLEVKIADLGNACWVVSQTFEKVKIRLIVFNMAAITESSLH